MRRSMEQGTEGSPRGETGITWKGVESERSTSKKRKIEIDTKANGPFGSIIQALFVRLSRPFSARVFFFFSFLFFVLPVLYWDTLLAEANFYYKQLKTIWVYVSLRLREKIEKSANGFLEFYQRIFKARLLLLLFFFCLFSSFILISFYFESSTAGLFALYRQ